jgi:hypothetical protein
VARRRSDERVWAMAQTDSRLMNELQTAMDRDDEQTVLSGSSHDLNTLMSRRVARLVKNRLHYI